MPKLTVTTIPRLLIRSNNGTFGNPTSVDARIDPADTTHKVWLGRTAAVTVGGTDDTTDGVPLLAGETWNRNLTQGQAWYVVADADVDVYFDYTGGHAEIDPSIS